MARNLLLLMPVQNTAATSNEKIIPLGHLYRATELTGCKHSRMRWTVINLLPTLLIKFSSGAVRRLTSSQG